MDFNLSEEAVILKDSAERFLREKCPPSLVKAMTRDEIGFPRDIWKEMAELGWLGLIYEEKYGGSNGSFLDLCVLFEEIGKTLLPSPFFCSAILAGLIINEAGDDQLKREYLPSIISGEKILTAALQDEKAHYDAESPRALAKAADNNRYFISGTRLMTPYAHVADEIILCARVAGWAQEGPTLFRIGANTPGQKRSFLNSMTEEKIFAVIYDNVEVPGENIIGSIGRGSVYLNQVLPKAVVLKCVEMVGGLERVLDMTVSHVKERRQFGHPLGSLQAVQHHCADMAAYLETSRLAAYQAGYLISEGLECGKEVAAAKAWCSEAYRITTWLSQQVHGGIGFTDEYDLHLYYKHAKACELAFEGSWFHRSKVADHMGL